MLVRVHIDVEVRDDDAEDFRATHLGRRVVVNRRVGEDDPVDGRIVSVILATDANPQ